MDTMEDRIHAAGHGDKFEACFNAFDNSDMSREKQLVFYDELIGFGATPEEADEFINMLIADYT